MNPEQHSSPMHLAAEEFRAALAYTAAKTGFSQQLIEKDYFCTLVLHELGPGFEAGLVFKGGTSLSKVHARFYRLSEDLDFAISVAAQSTLGMRRKTFKPIKEEVFAAIPHRQSSLRFVEPLAGHNGSKQYRGRLSYLSAVTGNVEDIKVDVSLREPILTPPLRLSANTLLLSSPSAAGAMIEAPTVTVLSVAETYAEKLRAALCRGSPKIRDFYDIGYAWKLGIINLTDVHLRELVAKKLAVRGTHPVDTSPAKLEIVSRQLAELRAVLRPVDYDEFDLRATYLAIAELAVAIAELDA